MTRRRDFLILGGAVAGVAGFGWWLRRPVFEFTALKSPVGFRRLNLGAVSGLNMFAGIDDPDPAVIARAKELANPCDALFRTAGQQGDVNIASFSDYNCPYCRVLTRELADIQSTGGIAVTWHELPLLTPSSEASARLALAAAEQGAYSPIHQRLMAGRFVPSPGFVRTVADDFDLDAKKLVADQTAQSVNDHLRDAKALANIFGIPGTPTLIVGKTMVVGNISPRELRALIELERDGLNPVCG